MTASSNPAAAPVYADSSALIKLCINEPESDELERGLAGFPDRVASKVVIVELLRSVKRRRPAALPLAVELLGKLALIDVDDRVLEKAVEVKPVAIRSLDAIHIATALSLGLDLGAFITYDRTQAEAARAAGLPVQSPGAR